MAAGLNRVTWNLAYPGATTFPGMVLWGATTNGPAAMPGAYQVRLTVDGKAQTQPLTIRRHPLRETTDADLQEQFALALRIRDKVSEANNAVIQIREHQARRRGADRQIDRRAAEGSRRAADEEPERGRGGDLPGPEPERPGSAQLPDQDQQPSRLAAPRRQHRRRQADRERRADLQGPQRRAEGPDRSAAAGDDRRPAGVQRRGAAPRARRGRGEVGPAELLPAPS